MAVVDMRGLLVVGPPVSKPDMPGIQNPLSGWPASAKVGFNTVGYPGQSDPTLAQTDPSSIADLAAWFKASDFDNIADGTEITSWLDHSGNGRGTTVIGSAGNRPTVSRNALNGNMTAVKSSTGGSKRGTVSNLGLVLLTISAKDIWTVFGVANFTANAATITYRFCVGGSNDVKMGITSTLASESRYSNVASFTNSFLSMHGIISSVKMITIPRQFTLTVLL
jgi:hypothetical protein